MECRHWDLKVRTRSNFRSGGNARLAHHPLLCVFLALRPGTTFVWMHAKIF